MKSSYSRFFIPDECVFTGVEISNSTLNSYDGIKTWQRCEKLCRGYVGCKYWSHLQASSKCNLYTQANTRSLSSTSTSGEIDCGMYIFFEIHKIVNYDLFSIHGMFIECRCSTF